MRTPLLLLVIGCGPSSPDATPDAPSSIDADTSRRQDVAVGLVSPGALALDRDSIYFTHGERFDAISRVGKLGGPVQPIAAGLRFPGALDASTDELCWAFGGSHSADFLDGSIRCAPKAGGLDREVSTAYMPSDLVVDGDTLYWVEIDGQRVRTIKRDGTGAQTLDSSGTHKTSIAMTATTLAWTASSDMADVVAMDRATSKTTTLSTEEYAADSALVIGGDVYWIVTYAHPNYLDGAIRVSRNGGPPIDLVPDEDQAAGLLHVDGSLYWLNGESKALRTVGVEGGTAMTIETELTDFGGFTTDGQDLFWSEPARGAIVRRSL